MNISTGFLIVVGFALLLYVYVNFMQGVNDASIFEWKL
jgi:uncharacterized membrane protein